MERLSPSKVTQLVNVIVAVEAQDDELQLHSLLIYRNI